MSQATIYHNPRCSKSRASLAILEAHDLDIKIIKYLETPPNPVQLTTLLQQLGSNIRSILRTSEADYKLHHFDDPNLSSNDLVKLVQQYPKVLERPIVVYKNQAVIGRPPENVLELIK